ncbi:hypothetical protein [Microbacterium nymphoidis]|uniref:hypothetical protein n=1 Tax=Microbacterium nymphoidis TaxID=2898586 RepID=UPI001E652D13|nr:hypothetical protein [Microbacterium nymphoidis]MCD2497502.1 hypothetical protein [Microbacterium nymphoidis]
MAMHDADPLPEPDHELGYSEELLADVLGEHMLQFHDYIMMKAHAMGPDGPVYYPSDVRRFVDYYVTRTARPLTEPEVRALFDTWVAERRGKAD